MSTKKKTIIITSIVIIAFIIIGTVYAFFSDKVSINNNMKIGTVEIEILNFGLKNEKNESNNIMSPADIDTISWTTNNKGTSGVLTRHTLEIYWESIEGEEDNQILYLFPANITRQAIISDYNKGENAKYLLNAESVTKEINGSQLPGIKYQFIGDTLDGTDMKNVSNEVNYNKLSEGLEDGVIDTNINTDDSVTTNDAIAFRLLMNPKLSYLYQSKKIYAKLTTEAMQYTEDGSANWQVVDTQEL